MYQKYYSSPIGLLKITCDEKSVLKITTTVELEENTPNLICDQAEEELRRYFKGELQSFNIPLKLNGSDFQIQVWQELLNVPFGKTVSYQELSNRIGKPKAIRAVANAVGANKWLVVVPCHRIIGSDKTLTGFSAGLENKIKLLRLENHQIKINNNLKNSKLV